MSLSTRLAGMFAGAAVVIFALIGTMLYCILDRQTERLQQGEVDVRFNMVSRMLDHPDLAERWPHLQGKLDNLSQEYELIRFWIDSDDPRYHYGRFSEPVQRLIADGAGRYELELPEHRYALTARVGVLPAREGRPRLTYVTAIDSAAFHEARTSTLKWLLGLSALGVLTGSPAWACGRCIGCPRRPGGSARGSCRSACSSRRCRPSCASWWERSTAPWTAWSRPTCAWSRSMPTSPTSCARH